MYIDCVYGCYIYIYIDYAYGLGGMYMYVDCVYGCHIHVY